MIWFDERFSLRFKFTFFRVLTRLSVLNLPRKRLTSSKPLLNLHFHGLQGSLSFDWVQIAPKKKMSGFWFCIFFLGGKGVGAGEGGTAS